MPLISAAGLRKEYGSGEARTVALDGVDLRIEAGQFTAVTGPSGSGKSTLLHCLSGVASPTAGRVLFDDVDLAALGDDARADLRGARMGFVFQAFNLLPALTAVENVEVPLVLRRTPARDVPTRSRSALDRFGLARRADAYPSQLSAGEQIRVALARALVAEPDVVWADEPTGALDSKRAQEVLRLLRELCDDGHTVTVVSHDQAVTAFADTCVTLVDGRLAA